MLLSSLLFAYKIMPPLFDLLCYKKTMSSEVLIEFPFKIRSIVRFDVVFVVVFSLHSIR